MSAFAALPAGQFGLIYADPPWRFEPRNWETGRDRNPDRHYGTATVAELAALKVASIAAPDAVLAMWVYDPMLPAALDLARAWGFEFTTVGFRWLKSSGQRDLFQCERLEFGLGYYTRAGGCEELWLFKRGRGLPVQRHDIRREFYSPRRGHSQKPPAVRDMLVALFGDVPRVELFARDSAIGWTSWGDEIVAEEVA